MKKITSILLSVIVLVGLFLTGCESSETTKQTGDKKQKKTLFISAIPDQKQSDLNTSMNELCKILSDSLHIPVKYKEVTDYTAVVNGFERNEIQLAWFGGLTGVQAREKVKDSKAVVQRIEDESFKSVFIAGANTDIKTLTDYKGKSFTFGSESSTSGHLMPRYFLSEAKINPEKDFKGEVGYSGSHDKTIELVSNGAYDGGALNIAVWDRYVKENLVDLTKVKVVEISPSFYDYNFSLQSKEKIEKEYGKGMYDKIVQNLLNIDVSNNKNLNVFFNTKGFIKTENKNYDKLKETAVQLGILK